MRDHLLGCQAYMPPEDGFCPQLRVWYGAGTPTRVARFNPYPDPVDRIWLTGDFDNMVREANAQTILGYPSKEEIRAHFKARKLNRATDAERAAFDARLKLPRT